MITTKAVRNGTCLGTTGTRSMIAVCYGYRIILYRINIICLFLYLFYKIFHVTLFKNKWLSFNTISLNEPRSEKTGLRGFRPGTTQNGL